MRRYPLPASLGDYMINRPIGEIDKSAIDALLSDEIPESRTLDYKEKLPGGKNDDRKEFLADVSAMANASGGDIVFGIAERREDGKPTGIPESVSGLGGVNLDAERLRLENWLRDGIDPRIIGLQMHPVEGFEDGPVLVLRVPRSYNSPHMVKTGDSRFYSRNSAGKYSLDVTEIRSAFASSEALPERIRRFRAERIARVVADETPERLPAHPKTVVHILPLSSFAENSHIDVAQLRAASNQHRPMSHEHLSSYGARHNFDGVITTGYESSSIPASYVQFFRNGCIEAVESLMLRGEHERQQGRTPLIPTTYFESTVLLTLDSYVRTLRSLGIVPPLIVMVSLIGVKGYYLATPQNMMFHIRAHTIDRDLLLLPDCLIQDFLTPLDKVIQPALDTLWQCIGFERDYLYQEEGKGRWSSRSDKSPLLGSPI